MKTQNLKKQGANRTTRDTKKKNLPEEANSLSRPSNCLEIEVKASKRCTWSGCSLTVYSSNRRTREWYLERLKKIVSRRRKILEFMIDDFDFLGV